MKLPLTALILASTILPASAQESDHAFLDRVFEVADPESETRIPVLCGGLYQTLATVFADDAETLAEITERQPPARNVAMVLYLLENEGQGIATEDAGAFIDARFTAVSEVFDEWVAHNRTNAERPITDGIGEAYRFCGTQHEDWTTVPGRE